MKKLLGGIFQKQKDPATPPTASLSPQLAAVADAAGARRGVSPPTKDRAYKTGPRSSWDTFFHSPNSARGLASLQQQTTASVSVPAKVFTQNLDMLTREIAAKTKDVITRMIEEREFQDEFTHLCGFINLAADKLLEKGGESPLMILQSYFASESGATLCEQSSLPSLVLDFVDKVRIYIITNELQRLHACLPHVSKEILPGLRAPSITPAELERSIHFLMTCVQAIASNSSLMEHFRCEIPNIIQLTAEDYPASALYLRDMSSQVLASIPDKNFNAGLVWYLNDCKIVGRTVRSIARYSEAPIASPETAEMALKALETVTKSHTCDPRSLVREPIAAAVTDALGLSLPLEPELNETRKSALSNREDLSAAECEDVVRMFKYGLTGGYNPTPGFKSLVYVLQKTCRHSLVLLGEFQSSGGYSLLLACIKRAAESDVPTLIYLVTLLLPLGTGFPGVWGEDGSMATVITCGARNVGVFLSMRDLVLECISDLKCTTQLTTRISLEQLLLQLLTTVLQVYTSAYDNFICLEQKTQALAMILSKLPAVEYFDAQVIILRIAEYVCAAARQGSLLPIEVLAVLCSQFIESSAKEVNNLIELVEAAATSRNDTAKANSNSEDVTTGLLCECVLKIIQVPGIPEYRDELHRFGFLDRAVYAHLLKVASSVSAHSSDPFLQQQYVNVFKSRLKIWSTMICCMIKDNTTVAVELRDMQVHQCLYVLAETMLHSESIDFKDVQKTPVLPIFFELAAVPKPSLSREGKHADPDFSCILKSGVESDLERFLHLLQRKKGVPKQQLYVLNIIRHMTHGSQLFWDAWLACQGHETILSILSSFQDLNGASAEENAAVFDAILEILCVTLDPTRTETQQSIAYFTISIRFSTLASCLLTSGVMGTQYWPSVLSRIFGIITGLEPPRDKIKNPHAVEIIFDLLPHMSVSQRQQSLKRLLSKIVSNDDLTFSSKRQVASLVDAGVFRWLAQPGITNLLRDMTCPSQNDLVQLIIEVSREELSTLHLREYLRVIAQGMPLLLENRFHPRNTPSICSDAGQDPRFMEEIGFRLLTMTMKGSSVRQAMVGTNVRTGMTSGYVHVVNQSERLWPPPNGYSFSCWIRFPPIRVHSHETAEAADCVHSTTAVCSALCEGPLMVKVDEDDSEIQEMYCILVGAELSFFESDATARSSSNPEFTVTVTSLAQKSELEFFVSSHESLYVVRIPDAGAEKVEMWVRALQQAQSISSRLTPQVKANTEGEQASDIGLESDNPNAVPGSLQQPLRLEGFVCLLSVYSAEASGCFTRIYFEQTNGCLRVDTGSAMPSSNVNPATKRTTVVFKNVSVDLLRAEAGSKSCSDGESKEKMAHWHHIAMSHKKSALGNSQITLYIDGAEVAKKKLMYPSAPSSGPMQAFVGKDIQVCGAYPALPWHLGPAWLVEDVFSITAAVCIFLLGPTFRGQLGGHAYQSIGDWPEAIATSLLDRATKRRVEVARAAKRAQLTQLGRAARRQWYESAPFAGDTQVGNLFTDILTRKEDSSESNGGGRSSETHKRQNTDGFRVFVSEECSMSVFGIEILQVFSSFKLEEDDILFSVNTSFEVQQQDPNNGRRHASLVNFVGTEPSTPLDIAKVAPSVGGITQLLLPLVENSWRDHELTCSLKLLSRCNRRNPSCLAAFLEINGYALVASMLHERSHLLQGSVLEAVVHLGVSGNVGLCSRISTTSNKTIVWPLVVDYEALRYIIISWNLREQLSGSAQVQLLDHLQSLIEPENPNSIFNARQLRQANLLSWILTFVAEICDGANILDPVSSMNYRTCFPHFGVDSHNRVLRSLLRLLTTYLQLESHPYDVTTIAETLLMSLGDSVSNGSNPFCAVVLQFLLDETEKADALAPNNAAVWGEKAVHRPRNDDVEPFAMTMANSVFFASTPYATKRKKDRPDGPLYSLTSPTSGHISQCRDSSGSSIDIVLCEIIRCTERGKLAKLEALLATRILLSLAQRFDRFSQHLFHTGTLLDTFKCVLRPYSSDCDFYTPILAIISNTPIRETKYHDPVVNPDAISRFTLPSPRGFEHPKQHRHLEYVWELLGSMLLENYHVKDKIAMKVTAAVLNQLSFMMELNDGFFGTVRHTSFLFLQLVGRCLLHISSFEHSIELLCIDDTHSRSATSQEVLSSGFIAEVNAILASRSGSSSKSSHVSACLELLKVFITRSLFETNDFSMNIMFLLEFMDDEVQKVPARTVSDGQRCWLSVMLHVVKHTRALSDNCSALVLKNLATMSVALSRYFVDQTKHQVFSREDAKSSRGSETGSANPECFGTDVLVFILSIIRMCGEPHIGQVVGPDDQQFFYGCFVYSAQAILLSELTGVHTTASPSARLLDCLLHSKHYFVQQNKVAGVIVCGGGHHHASSTDMESVMTANAPANSRGLNAHLSKMKSLTVSAFHKEFGIGAESDRSFLLSLAAELLRWLVDDLERVRYASISMWQFLFQQRMGVLKELLVVEPKVSLLQNMSSSKKEMIDVFHGGFDRLLKITLPRTSTDVELSRVRSGELSGSHESWLQFHIWLTDNYDFLKELILTRTEPILDHMIDVLQSCQVVRKVNSSITGNRSTTPVDLDLDYARHEYQQRIRAEQHGYFATPNCTLSASQDDRACWVAVRKALLKLANLKECAVEEMTDATLRWLRMSSELQNTRAIWAVRTSDDATGASRAHSGSHRGELSKEPFYVQRSIFQRNDCLYRLDFTEGPVRMRLRLIKRVGIAVEVSDTQTSSDQSQGTELASQDPLQVKLEFHQSVEAFREYIFKRSKLLETSDICAEIDLRILNEIAADCNVDRVKALLKDVMERSDCSDYVTAIATRIYSVYLEGDKSSGLDVSDAVAHGIAQVIASARDSFGSSHVKSTIFDLADFEAMRATLNVATTKSQMSVLFPTEETNDSDQDDDEGMTADKSSAKSRICDSEDSSSEDESNNASREIALQSSKIGPIKTPESDAKGQTTEGEDQKLTSESDALFDTSLDYVYGGIARFLMRGDYPPLRSFNGAYVVGMSKIVGVFLVCKSAVYFVGGYTKVYGDSSSGLSGDSLPVSINTLNSGSPTKAQSGKKKAKDVIRDTFADIGLSIPGSKQSGSTLYTIVRLSSSSETVNRMKDFSLNIGAVPGDRWSIRYTDVKQFYRMKYQLRPVGIEFFDTSGSTFFMHYDSFSDREEIVKLLFQMPIVNSIFWNPLLRSSALSLSVKRIRQALTKRWLKGGISNFEYLINLNTLAGRSFNDITQYPVFPWVLVDYSSQFLDFGNSGIYRDLSKPMGAIGGNRATLFRERFAAMNCDAAHSPMDSPAFHYGTHYSCSAYVVNYLIRLEPFSQLARDLQGGSFDHADRLFRSISSSWHSASTENLQDVRELIPEFFFLPEFLFNANGYNLGTTQGGEVVSHVKLPPWAHEDPREFIRLHRCALESKFVSENLHHWIDLIFGYKQTGTPALEAQNVFMHFTYEGAVDLDTIEDSVMRNAMVAQIENFGQTPSKLFAAPHPARKVPSLVNQSLPSVDSTEPVIPGIGQPYEGNTISTIESYIKWHTPLAPALVSIGKDYVFLKKHSAVTTTEGPIGSVQIAGEKMLSRGVGCTFVPPRFTKYLDWGSSPDGTMRLRVHNSSARHREANKVVGIIEGAHYSRVNCVAFSGDGVVLVSGGEDAVVNVLECKKLHGQRQFKQIVKLVGHEDAVTSVDVDRTFNIIASGSRDGLVILWDLRTRTFMRELDGYSGSIVAVGINSASGNIAACTSLELRLWSVNGDLLAATTVQSVGLSPMTCALSTRCENWQNGVFAATGHSNGTIALWGLMFPSEIAAERCKTDESSDRASIPTTRAGATLSSGTLRAAIKIGVSPPDASNLTHSGQTVMKAIPSCRFAIKKLLVDHRTAITTLTLGPEQRQLVSADAAGHCIRWIDDSISTNII